ncbi:MAG: RDD family protein [Phycisphaerales bacterium]|nr:MAG: RDD family protein [Phycisphaerales bacterium]
MNMQQPMAGGAGGAGGGSDGWYYALGSSRFGPVPMGRLVELIRVGQVRPETLVWREGMGDWVAARSVAELQATLAGAAQAGTHAAPPTAPGQIGFAGDRTIDPTNYAGFWVRFAAYLLDCLIITVPIVIVTFVLAFLVGMVAGVSGSGGPGGGGGGGGGAAGAIAGGIMLLVQLAAIVATWLYFAMLESGEKQATFGKRALGIIVADTNGQRISFGKANLRMLGKVVNGFTFLIGWIMAGFTQKKQGLHDIIAGTVVLKK